MLAVALVCGRAAQSMRMPRVLGELLGGVILGPTVLGVIAPETQAWLFGRDQGPVGVAREAVVKLGLLGFLFAAGLDIDPHHFRARRRALSTVSLFGIAVPFVLGCALPVLFRGLLGDSIRGDALVRCVFLGTALSISALPVIARILVDLDLHRTAVASVVLGAATVDDLIGWALFTSLLNEAASTAGESHTPWLSLALVLALAALTLTAGRKFARWASPRVRQRFPDPDSRIGLAVVVGLAGAALIQSFGIHAAFGAFLAGAALCHGRTVKEPGDETVQQLALGVLAPLYFVSIGLKADLATGFDLRLTVVVLAVACVGKWLGAGGGAWLGGMSQRESLAVGVAMNARGAMEILLASVALEARLIDLRLFVALVVMALVTTMISAPLLRRLMSHPLDATYPRAKAHRGSAPAS